MNVTKSTTTHETETSTMVDAKMKKYLDGPDQVLPAASLVTTSPEGKVQLRLGQTSPASLAPISVPGLLDSVSASYPQTTALACRKCPGNDWTRLTYSEYRQAVRTCAKAFLNLGLKRWHAVCILGFNSPEWFISDLAAVHAGGLACGIYTTNSAEACHHCLSTSRANIVVVENHEQLEKILAVRDRLPELTTIIQYTGTPQVPGVLSWEDVMRIGRQQSDEQLERILKTMAVNECCTIVYTSGTVGYPKASMLSHDNLTWTAFRLKEVHELELGEEHVAISFLPLSHVAAQVIDIYAPLTLAATIYFADKNALKGTLKQTIKEVRPTSFFGVPRVWEKIHDAIELSNRQSGNLKSGIISWAKRQGLQHNMDKKNGIYSNTFGYRLAKYLVLDRVKRAVGFDRSKVLFSGAAPMPPEILKYFMSFDMVILDGYGMSESPVHSACGSKLFQVSSCGRGLPGTETKIHAPDEEGQGEIWIRGRQVFMGYINDMANTQASVDSEGWLHTGDIGRQDDSGFIYILGRLKELIITSGGENVAPLLIENEIKKELPFVSHAFLVGDKRKFLSILLTCKTDLDPDTGLPLDELNCESKNWLRNLSCDANTVTQLLQQKNTKVMEAVQAGIDQVNRRAISNAQKIQKFAILPEDFSMKNGEIGPTMKLKRSAIAAKYSSIIEEFYKNV